MSRTERERWKFAGQRWPSLQEFIGRISEDFFKPIEVANKVILDNVIDLPPETKKNLARECRDFISYFSRRKDDVHMLLDGLGASVPAGKIQYEGTAPKGVARITLLYAELARLIRKDDQGWEP